MRIKIVKKILMVGLSIAGFLGSVNAHAILINGDFNGDGVVDQGDVNLLTTEISNGTNHPSFDITSDGVVDLQDLDAWFPLLVAANGAPELSTAIVDLNFDLVNNLFDFEVIRGNLNLVSSFFTDGDMNADGIVDNNDIARYLNLGGEAPPPEVPVPATLALLSLGLAGLGWSRRKKA